MQKCIICGIDLENRQEVKEMCSDCWIEVDDIEELLENKVAIPKIDLLDRYYSEE